MAFYKVTVEGKEYVNQHLCRTANRFGDAGLLRAVANKELTQKQVFDNILFSSEPQHQDNYACMSDQIIVQDIDEAVAHLQASKEDATADSITVSRPDLVVYKYKKFRFVKLSDITDAKKYRHQVRMATVQVCGCIYVAVNAVNDTQKQPIVVTIKE